MAEHHGNTSLLNSAGHLPSLIFLGGENQAVPREAIRDGRFLGVMK